MASLVYLTSESSSQAYIKRCTARLPRATVRSDRAALKTRRTASKAVCAERTMGILYGLELDTGFYRRGLTFERIVGDFGEQLIVLVIECEDAKLNDLGRDEFE